MQTRRRCPYTASLQDYAAFWRRVPRLARAATRAFAADHWRLSATDLEEPRFPAKAYVWVRWFIGAAGFIVFIYRPDFRLSTYVVYSISFVIILALNAALHYRVGSGGAVTIRWILAFSALDVVVITVGLVASGGFSHFFFYLMYYPALASFALFVSSHRLCLAWVTTVAFVYTGVSITVGSGLDLEARDEKALFARIAVMYAIVVLVNLVSRFERIRRQEAVERERVLQRERIELSQAIHDTAAQSVYMIGLGVESAIDLAGKSNRELVAKLEATSELSKSAMWELRHPIELGQLVEGRELNQALSAHAATFSTITSVPAEVVQSGFEPALPSATRTTLFAIAHNALTNALRHARASKVTIALEFAPSGLRMSVSDNGIGLPDDYAGRGHGFEYMRADAARLGGSLNVQSGGPGRGTTVTCAIEYD